MKRIFSDVKSFVTIALTLAFILLAFMKCISGQDFYNLFLIVISFYYGTQHEKLRPKDETKDNSQEKISS